MKRFLLTLVDLLAALYHPLARLRNRLGDGRARVLIYHRVCDAPPERGLQYWNVPPALFAAQMDYLRKAGYHVLTAAEVAEHLLADRRFPARTVAITFDDGYRNNYTHAFPILQRNGLRATFYVTTGFIERRVPFPFMSTDAAIEEAGARDSSIWEPLRWSDLAEMAAGGMEIASHSQSHPFFSTLTPSEVDQEVDESHVELRNRGFRPRTFAVSYSLIGERVPDLERALRRHGIEAAFLGAIGSVRRGSHPFDLPRIPVYENDDLSTFRRRIDGAYDWMTQLHPLWRRLFHRPIHGNQPRLVRERDR